MAAHGARLQMTLDEPTDLAPIARAVTAAHRRARLRARRDDIHFDLSHLAVMRMAAAQDWRCALSGIAFDLREVGGAFVKRPFAPSLDRISSAAGYVPSNVRLTTIAVNFGLGQWGDEIFLAVASAVVRRAVVRPPARLSGLDERIEAAEALLPILEGQDRVTQLHRIAGLKATRTKGRDGMRRAAERAWRTRRC